jgi:hypothetical protein
VENPDTIPAVVERSLAAVVPFPTPGRIVHYVLPESVSRRSAGQVRPAIIVRVWESDHPSVQLQVFTDGSNDLDEGTIQGHSAGREVAERIHRGILWATSVHYDPSGKPGTYHWPTHGVVAPVSA